MISVRPVESDADLEAWIRVRRLVLPNEPAATVEQMRALEAPRRLLLLAELDGELAGSGLADRSDMGGGFVAPRVLPEHRRRGVGSALLERLLEHLRARDFDSAAGARRRSGVRSRSRSVTDSSRSDREVEQVRAVLAESRSRRRTTASSSRRSRSDATLLERAYAVASQGYADLALTSGGDHDPAGQSGSATRRRCPAARSSLSTATGSSATPG